MEINYEYTDHEWNIICNEFRRTKGHHYLDHAGTTLYAENQLKDIFENMSANLYSNPHTSKTTEDLIDQVRFKILQHFNTTADEYSIVFTSGTTASLKLVAECFNFTGSTSSSNGKSDLGNFLYFKESHTSVLGMREIVKTTNIFGITKNDLLAKRILKSYPVEDIPKYPINNSLLVFPAQCNFNGFKYPLDLVDAYQCNTVKTYPPSKWHVCLDAASFASTNQLDLSKYKPDFVCISFYKMFGYPTGLGALIVSKRGERALEKKYYGGGTVKIALSDENWHVKRDCFHERFEDGTLPFLSIISLLSGFNTLEKLIPPNDLRSTWSRLSSHTFQLGQYLYNQLNALKYSNGKPVIKFYQDTDFKSTEYQGAIVNFNILHSDGQFVGFSEVACLASVYNITLRTGCFCNPGACQRHLCLSTEDLRDHYKAGHICGDANDLINGIPTGSVRISIGYMTSKDDIDAVLKMIIECYLSKEKQQILNSAMIKKFYKVNGLTARELEPILAEESISPSIDQKVKLKEICIYPIKSCGSMKIYTKWPLTHKGLKYDREWMIVTGSGAALTQKNETKLCLIRPEIYECDGFMKLNFPYINPICVPLNPGKLKIQTGSLCQSKVCGDRVEGVDCGDEVADWLTDALCINGLRLLKQSSSDKRCSKQKKTESDIKTSQSISLSNQAQFLLINTKSVAWLTKRVTEWTDQPDINAQDQLEGVIDRFRGNLIIEAPAELDEQNWKYISIGNVKFHADGPCVRCQMICIDQWTGEKTAEPLRTIAREFQGKMRFGLYLSRQQEPSNHQTDDIFISCDSDIIVERKH